MTGCATVLKLNNTTDPSPRPIETGRDGNYRLPVCCCRDNHSLKKNDYNRPFKHVCHARRQTLSSTTDPNSYTTTRDTCKKNKVSIRGLWEHIAEIQIVVYTTITENWGRAWLLQSVITSTGHSLFFCVPFFTASCSSQSSHFSCHLLFHPHDLQVYLKKTERSQLVWQKLPNVSINSMSARLPCLTESWETCMFINEQQCLFTTSSSW